MIDTKGCTVIKTVLGEDLEKHTSAGWVLLDVVRRSTVLPSFSQEYAPAQAANPQMNYYPPPPMAQTMQKNLVVEQPWFLVGKDDTSAIAALAAERDKALADVLACQGWLREEQKKTALLPLALAAVSAHVKEKDENLAREQKGNVHREAEVKAHIASERALVEKIELIKKAIGERTLKDILEPEIATARERLAVVLKDEGVLST